jgi:hypothetical protein
MKGSNLIKISNGKMSADEYFNHLTIEFPILRDKINEWESDMVFLRMELFAEYTIEQIKSENKLELKKCFNFQESKIDFIDSLLLNAMTVSYCEALLLGECSRQMKLIVDFMGPKLRNLYDDYEKYYNDLGKIHNKNRKGND